MKCSSFDLDAKGRSTDWLEVVMRIDRTERKFDVFLNKTLIAYNVFSYSVDPVASLQIYAAGNSNTLLDAISLYDDNPLFPDADKDGMSDAYELANGLNPYLNDREADPDNDGLTNLQENIYGLNPFNADTDGDGMPDAWEVANGFDPRKPESFEVLNNDEDGDGLTALQEAKLGTNPHRADTDNDGMSDGAEAALKLNPLDPLDATLDNDSDGINNLQECLNGTDPNDYYNGASPVFTSLIGQQGELGENNCFKVLVKNSDGTILRNAPVKFEITEGKTRLAASPDSNETSINLEVRSDDEGIATVYVFGERP